MRLIDADALKKEIRENDPFGGMNYEWYIDHAPTIVPASLCHRAEEPPKEDGWYILGFLSRWKNGSWWIPKFPDYWMTAGAPKEE